jgi:hypothetical protein
MCQVTQIYSYKFKRIVKWETTGILNLERQCYSFSAIVYKGLRSEHKILILMANLCAEIWTQDI